MDVRDVSSTKDLRAVTFSDLFYELFDAPGGMETAVAIARRLEPGYAENDLHRELHADLEELKDAIAMYEPRIIDHKTVPPLSITWPAKHIRHAVTKDYDMGFHILSGEENFLVNVLMIEFRFFFLEFDSKPCFDKSATYVERIEYYDGLLWKDNAVAIDYAAVVDFLLDCPPKDKDSWGKNPVENKSMLMDWFFCYEYVKRGVLEEINRRLEGSSAIAELPINKYREALLLIPSMRDDQDMIVFFGNNFHKSFEDVNAYTGLLYAYECFEYEGLV